MFRAGTWCTPPGEHCSPSPSTSPGWRRVGTPVTVLPRLVRKPQGAGDFDVAPSGMLAYVDAPDFGASGAHAGVGGSAGPGALRSGAPRRGYIHPRISPDGSRVSVVIGRTSSRCGTLHGRSSVRWCSILAILRCGQLTGVVCSASARGWCAPKAADGTGVAERLADGLPSGVTLDGKQVLINGVPGSVDVMVLTLDGTHHVEPLVRTPATERNGVVSPNGRWLAYESDSSGRIRDRRQAVSRRERWDIADLAGGRNRPVWA